MKVFKTWEEVVQYMASEMMENEKGGQENEPPKEDIAKDDARKPRLSLVPRQIIWDIAEVREYGTRKYKDPDNWKRVAPQRYMDAAYRHFMAFMDDPDGVDEESGLPHLSHLACNIAFLCEMRQMKEGGEE